MAMTTTAISLDEALLARIDNRASELRMTQSQLLALAVEEYLDSHAAQRRREERKAARLKEINQAWAAGLDAEERTVLRGMRKKYREVVAKDPW